MAKHSPRVANDGPRKLAERKIVIYFNLDSKAFIRTSLDDVVSKLHEKLNESFRDPIAHMYFVHTGRRRAAYRYKIAGTREGYETLIYHRIMAQIMRESVWQDLYPKRRRGGK
jgi:hypothetical protein